MTEPQSLFVDLSDIVKQSHILLEGPRFEVEDIRGRVLRILNGPYPYPRYIGLPPATAIIGVRDQVLEEMARKYWLLDGQPDGKDKDHWEKAVKDWNRAVAGWESLDNPVLLMS